MHEGKKHPNVDTIKPDIQLLGGTNVVMKELTDEGDLQGFRVSNSAQGHYSQLTRA